MDIKIDRSTALVFDLDDTLYNEIEYLKSAYWYICSELTEKDTEILYNHVFSIYRNGDNPFLYLAEKFDVSIDYLIFQYRNHFPTIKPFPGVLELLQGIKKRQGKIGIVTDGRTVTQSNKLKALGIWNLIDCCIISESVGTEKPSKRNFKLIEKDLKVSKYFYFGDNFKKDFITPAYLGWHTIGLIDNGLNIHPNSCYNALNSPESLIRSFNEISVV